MAEGIIFSEKAFRDLQAELRRLRRLVVNLEGRFRAAPPQSAEREDTLLAQANAAISFAGADQAGSGEFSAVTMDADGNLATSQRTVTGWVLPDGEIASGDYALLVRDFRKGRWVAMTGGGGGGVTLYRFSLNEDLADGSAGADILNMDGTPATTDTILDPEGIFSTLETDATGLCLLQGGFYYVIQANCPA
jgi:hypothetical protein